MALGTECQDDPSIGGLRESAQALRILHQLRTQQARNERKIGLAQGLNSLRPRGETIAMSISVLLVNLGTTRSPEPGAVREFLAEFLSDPAVVDYPPWLWRPVLRKVLRARPEKVAEQYRTIWTEEGSPLEQGTRSLANALGRLLGREVRYAHRYGRPSLREELAGERRKILAVPLFPQRTGSTTGSIEIAIGRSSEGAEIRRIAPDDPGYIGAISDLFARTVANQPPDHFVVSFHGIPLRYHRKERGRYRADCETTYRAVLRRIDWPEEKATLSYQSRFGPEPWLRPATAAVLERLGAKGVGRVAVATPGFLTEGLETLEEIEIRGRRTFEEAGGGELVRIPAVEAHPDFVRALAALVTGRSA
jgi:ferrochelatase